MRFDAIRAELLEADESAGDEVPDRINASRQRARPPSPAPTQVYHTSLPTVYPTQNIKFKRPVCTETESLLGSYVM